MTWKTLEDVTQLDLIDARQQLHQAAQIVASAGITFLVPRPDDSHPNFGWVESLGALVGRVLPEREVRIGLRLAEPSLLVIDKDGKILEQFALDGRSLEDGYAWLTSMTDPPDGLTRAAYDIPDHPVAQGATISAKPMAAFEELSRWFANGHEMLVGLAARMPDASDVRCWPHHFDLGLLVNIETASDASRSKSIGIGLSPGDEHYAEPYLYISPWPYPDATRLPALESGGHWHTEGFTSAILTRSEVVEGPVELQSNRFQAFLHAAVDACRNMLSDPEQG